MIPLESIYDDMKKIREQLEAKGKAYTLIRVKT